MRLKEFLTLRVNILLLVLILSLLAINPNPWAEGVKIEEVQGSALDSGLKQGMKILSINSQPIKTLENFNTILDSLVEIKEKTILVKTENSTVSYNTLDDLGFLIDNLTIINPADFTKLNPGEKLISINNKQITTDLEFEETLNEILPVTKVVIETNKGTFGFLTRKEPEIIAKQITKTNLVQGLDLRGGTRVLLEPISEDTQPVTETQISDLVRVLNNRLNTYGLSDVKIRSATDLSNNKFILVELAGVSQEEVKELIAKQGKFEAKIGEDIVFIGGNRDIPFVCRDDGTCSGIRPPCNQLSQSQWQCTFQFVIHLSPEATKRHAEITSKLDVNFTTGSPGGGYLSEPLDLYLDNKLVESLQISESLKGQQTSQIQISGPGIGTSQEDAFNSAVKAMEKLQTILITGSLPLKLTIVQLNEISPTLGSGFISNTITAGILGLIAVGIVVYIRYRKLKLVIPMMFTVLCEIWIILGISALIQWNLDLVSIAGIIAAIGTGIDAQIVIIDEILSGETKYVSWKERIKRAFSIILVSYAATFAAMIPLWNAGAGLVRGLAVTTIIGISIGVFLTRPAFASVAEKLI